MISEKEKYIYNLYLKSVRNGQGWRPRKDFDDFENDKNYPFLQKLVIFFDKHINILPEEFFKAPYKLHDDERYLSLDWYLNPAAIKMYQGYKQFLLEQGPDIEENISSIKNSIIFIRRFCNQNNIKIDDYISHKTGYIPSFILHLKNRDIIIYVLFYFNNFEKELYYIEDDVRAMMLGNNFLDSLDKYRSLYYNSKVAKPLIEKIFKKL